MKIWSIVCLAICLTAGLGACTKAGTDTSEPAATDNAAPATPEPAAASEPAPAAPTPAPEASAATPAAPAEPTAAAATTNGLEGTTWKVGPFMAHFKDATKVHVSGGELAEQMPDGIDAVYTVKDGAVEVTVLNGIVKKGTWNGSSLVIDGMVGEKQS